jgi:hypothetical protein
LAFLPFDGVLVLTLETAFYINSLMSFAPLPLKSKPPALKAGRDPVAEDEDDEEDEELEDDEDDDGVALDG